MSHLNLGYIKFVMDSRLHASRRLVDESRARIQSGRATAAAARQRIQKHVTHSRPAPAVWTLSRLLAARVEQSMALITMSRELIQIGDELVALSRQRR